MKLPTCLRRRPRYTLEVFEAKDGWRFRARAANHEIVFQSESYTRRSDAERAARAICAAKLRLES